MQQPMTSTDDTVRTDEQAEIFVRAEWGELKECVYGGYHQFVFPKFLQDADVRPSGEFRQFWFEHQEQNVAGS